MDSYNSFADIEIAPAGIIAKKFLALEISTFHRACTYVHRLPYGYNTDRDDLMGLFTEGKGSCTTKHAVIATLAQELGLPVGKQIGTYAMTENLVTGTAAILEKYALPYLPMIHCFLSDGTHRVDLTEGNHNGKNGPINDFLHTAPVIPNIPAKEEYMLYRNALKDEILNRDELKEVTIKTILQAREEGLVLLKEKV